MLSAPARVLAAADEFRSVTQPRPYRPALSRSRATRLLTEEANAGRLDVDAVEAVLHVAGELTSPLARPRGLTHRETQVLGLLARGLTTRQVARSLGVAVKTADRHVQNAYRKIGVSSRAGAALFAMEHGLVAWGELPIGERSTAP
jgi:DNA-binding NarL/FixJ family response regulator